MGTHPIFESDFDCLTEMVQQKSLSKIVIRRLPPDMTETELREILAPIPPHDYFKFHVADKSLAPVHTCRAYINFPNFDNVLQFRDRFDGQIFEDKRGQEYPAFVEVSPFQLIPKNRNHECKYKGSIQEDPEFAKFKEQFENDEADEVQQINIEAYLKEAAAKEDARKQTQSTPLIDFIRNKRETKKRLKDERRRDEKRKRRDEQHKAKRKLDKERLDRKKDLIDSKNSHKRDDNHEHAGKPTESGDQKSDQKKGGRFAAREKRKKEFEERRKQKQASEKAKKSEEKPKNQKSEAKDEQPAANGKNNKRYSRRKENRTND